MPFHISLFYAACIKCPEILSLCIIECLDHSSSAVEAHLAFLHRTAAEIHIPQRPSVIQGKWLPGGYHTNLHQLVGSEKRNIWYLVKKSLKRKKKIKIRPPQDSLMSSLNYPAGLWRHHGHGKDSVECLWISLMSHWYLSINLVQGSNI